MEADKLTVFLFLMLVVVMAFSGFVLYDALTGMPALGKAQSGVPVSVRFNNLAAGGNTGVEISVQFNNLLEGGVR